MQRPEQTISIDAPPTAVWDALTRPELMRRWMGDPSMDLSVEIDWTVGGAMVTRGFHHVPFENRGRVLRHEPPSRLVYTHLSSIS